MAWFGKGKQKEQTQTLPAFSPSKSSGDIVVEGVVGEETTMNGEVIDQPEGAVTVRSQGGEENKEVKTGFTKSFSGYDIEFLWWNKLLKISYNGESLFKNKIKENIKEKVTNGEVTTVMEEVVNEHQDKVIRYQQWARAYQSSSEKFGRAEHSNGIVTSNFKKYEVEMEVDLIIQWVSRMETMEAPIGVTPIETKNSGYDLAVVLRGKSVHTNERDGYNELSSEIEPFIMELDAGQSPTDYLDRIYYYGAQYFVDAFDPQRNAKDMLDASLNKHRKRNARRAQEEDSQFRDEENSENSMDDLDRYLLKNGKGGTTNGEDVLRKTVLQEGKYYS